MPVVYFLTEPQPKIAPINTSPPEPTPQVLESQSVNERLPNADLQTARMSAFAGQPEQTVILVPMMRDNEKYALLAQMIRDSGLTCNGVENAYTLKDTNRNDLPIYKIDCENHISVQATELNNRLFLKPWTGSLFK
jgi:hypothetical protein